MNDLFGNEIKEKMWRNLNFDPPSLGMHIVGRDKSGLVTLRHLVGFVVRDGVILWKGNEEYGIYEWMEIPE